MKIAVPTRGNVVDDHFGHCEAYTLFTTDGKSKIEKSEHLPSPQGCGCKSNIASILKEHGVTVLLAGNMGDGALNVLNNAGIKVHRGCTGDAKNLVESYLQGQVNDSGVGCTEHADGHECNH